MELRDFVSKSLKDIVSGIQDAQRATGGGVIVPKPFVNYSAIENGTNDIACVEFEVAVKADGHIGHGDRIDVVTDFASHGGAAPRLRGHGLAATLAFRVPVKFPHVIK